MLSDNIRNLRKNNNLSQEDLAEKIGVSRQSVSFWETGQTQPTIENIISLAKVFNVSSDVLLDNVETFNPTQNKPDEFIKTKKKSKIGLISAIAVVLIICIILPIIIFMANSTDTDKTGDAISISSPANDKVDDVASDLNSALKEDDSNKSDNTQLSVNSDDVNSSLTQNDASNIQEPSSSEVNQAPEANDVVNPTNTVDDVSTVDTDNTVEADNTVDIADPPAAQVPFDLFTYCRDFAIEIGNLNGDYTIYQQPSTKYGGYPNEYFSISYWADSDMVEFCLHCPLDDTLSHNFYLRMRGGYNGEYEYLSSKYFRDNGEGLRSASGYINPSVFNSSYPINCNEYIGSADGQNEFMEQTRVGMCDLIGCLEQFVTVEGMECNFSDFGFVNF